MSKITVILGHPDNGSLSSALGRAYAEGATESGAEVRILSLCDIEFDPILHHGYTKRQTLEPDLEAAWQDIVWANHLVFAYPNWWGTMPALLKGFIDRLFLPGMAFGRGETALPEKLLKGRSGRLLVTMDSPSFYYRLFLGAPGDRAMKKAVLRFCGIAPVRITSFYGVKRATEETRRRWVEATRMLGRGLQQ